MLAILKQLDARKLALYSIGFAFFSLPISTSASAVFYILTVAIVLFTGRWREKWQTIMSNPITYWLFGFALLLLVGALYSNGQPHFIKHDLYKHLWIFLTPLFFWIFAREQDRRLALQFFLVSMMVVMFFSYLKYLDLIPMHNYIMHLLHLEAVGGRATVFQSHISQSFFMAFAAGCWSYFFITGAPKKWWNFTLALASGVNLLFLNSGRTGFVVYIALMLFLFFRSFSMKKFIICALSLFAVAALAFLSSRVLHNRIEAISKNVHVRGTSIGLRVAMIENGWQIFKKKPWFGYGTGGFSAGYAALPQVDIDKTKPGAKHPGLLKYTLENSFLNIMIEYGVVGLLFLLAFIIALWRYTLCLVRPYDVLMQGFLLIFFAGAMATAFFASSFSKHMFSIMLALAYGGLVLEPKTRLVSRLKFSLTSD